jgi:hypothetical protein
VKRRAPDHLDPAARGESGCVHGPGLVNLHGPIRLPAGRFGGTVCAAILDRSQMWATEQNRVDLPAIIRPAIVHLHVSSCRQHNERGRPDRSGIRTGRCGFGARYLAVRTTAGHTNGCVSLVLNNEMGSSPRRPIPTCISCLPQLPMKPNSQWYAIPLPRIRLPAERFRATRSQ